MSEETEKLFAGRNYLNLREAGEYMGVHRNTVRRWINNPKSPLRASRMTENGPLIVAKTDLDRILLESKYPELERAKQALDVTDERMGE